MKMKMWKIERGTDIPNIETAVDAYNFADNNLKVFMNVINKNSEAFNKLTEKVFFIGVFSIVGIALEAFMIGSFQERLIKLEEAQKEE